MHMYMHIHVSVHVCVQRLDNYAHVLALSYPLFSVSPNTHGKPNPYLLETPTNKNQDTLYNFQLFFAHFQGGRQR